MKKFIIAPMIAALVLGSVPVHAMSPKVRMVTLPVSASDQQIWTLKLPPTYKLEGQPDVAQGTLAQLKADYLDKLKAKYPGLDVYKEFYAGENKYLVSDAAQRAGVKVDQAQKDFGDAVQKFNALNKAQGIMIQITDPAKGEYVVVQTDPGSAGGPDPKTSAGTSPGAVSSTPYSVIGDSSKAVAGTLASTKKPDPQTSAGTYVGGSAHAVPSVTGYVKPGEPGKTGAPKSNEKSPDLTGAVYGSLPQPAAGGGIKPIILGNVEPGGGIHKFPGGDLVERGARKVEEAGDDFKKTEIEAEKELKEYQIYLTGTGNATPSILGEPGPDKPVKPVEDPEKVEPKTVSGM